MRHDLLRAAAKKRSSGGEGGGGSYRYLRLYVTVANSGYPVLGEIYWVVGGTDYPTQSMSSNNTSSPASSVVTSANSEYPAGTSYQAWRAFNRTGAGDYWNPANTSVGPWWIQVDLGEGNEISPDTIGIMPHHVYSVSSFTCLGSNTGAFAGEETTLLTVTGATTDWSPSTRRNFVIMEPEPPPPPPPLTGLYRFLKWYCPSANGGGNAALINIRWKVGASEYPTVNMTSGNTPAPYVATENFGGPTYGGWRVFDGDLTPASWFSSNPQTVAWIVLDLGAGNGLTPTGIAITPYYSYSPSSFICYGSTTGAFAGEEVTLYNSGSTASGWVSNTRRDFTF